MSAGVEGSKRLRPRPPARPSSRALAAEAAAAFEVGLSPAPPESGEVKPNQRDQPANGAAEGRTGAPAENGGPVKPESETEPHDHPLLIDAHEDRWAWRRRIRQSPRKLFFYRICVALLGLLLVCLAALTGPLPGPGGIPLALLGIAVWSSEFEWAQRLMYWFKAQLKRYLSWPRAHRILFWVLFGVCCGSVLYVFLLTFGVPFWVPEFVAAYLRHLPGV